MNGASWTRTFPSVYPWWAGPHASAPSLGQFHLKRLGCVVFRAVLGSGEGDWFSTLFTSVECVGSRGGNDLGSGDLSAPALGLRR